MRPCTNARVRAHPNSQLRCHLAPSPQRATALQQEEAERIAQAAGLVATYQQQQDALNVQLAREQARLQELTARMQGQQARLHEAKAELKRRKDVVGAFVGCFGCWAVRVCICISCCCLAAKD